MSRILKFASENNVNLAGDVCKVWEMLPKLTKLHDSFFLFSCGLAFGKEKKASKVSTKFAVSEKIPARLI